MKSRKRFQVRCVLILILSLLLTACESGKSSEKKEEDKKKENVSEAGEVSKEAQAVIETMMTAPNPDLLFTPSVIGEGVEEDEDAVRKTQEKNDIVQERWEEEVGTYFAEGQLENFLSSGPALVYLLEAENDGLNIKVKEMTPGEKGEDKQQVIVRYEKGDQETETVLNFERDSDGKFIRVTEERDTSHT